jgi:ferredoxin
MTNLCKKLLEQIGLNPERLRIEWVSASEGIRFAELITGFTKQLKELGPLGIGEGKDLEQLRLDLKAVENLVRKRLTSYYIDPDKCQGCMMCLRKCPVGAIIGGKNQIHVIDQDKCIACGICFQNCPPRFGAVKQILAEPVPPPIPEEARTLARKSKDT